MKNKKLMLGIAAGAAILAGAAVLLSKKRDNKRYAQDVNNARDHFKGKLNELERRAKKELKHGATDLKDSVNTTKDRATEWVNKANS